MHYMHRPSGTCFSCPSFIASYPCHLHSSPASAPHRLDRRLDVFCSCCVVEVLIRGLDGRDAGSSMHARFRKMALRVTGSYSIFHISLFWTQRTWPWRVQTRVSQKKKKSSTISGSWPCYVRLEDRSRLRRSRRISIQEVPTFSK